MLILQFYAPQKNNFWIKPHAKQRTIISFLCYVRWLTVLVNVFPYTVTAHPRATDFFQFSRNAMHDTCCTILQSKTLYNSAIKDTVQCCNQRHCTILQVKTLHNTASKDTVQCCNQRHCTMLQSKTLYNAAIKDTVQYCNQRHCTILQVKTLYNTAITDTVQYCK